MQHGQRGAEKGVCLIKGRHASLRKQLGNQRANVQLLPKALLYPGQFFLVSQFPDSRLHG